MSCMRKVSEMKVKDIIEMLNKHYKPEQDLFFMWWDEDCLTYAKSYDDVAESEYAEVWASVVTALEMDEYMDECVTGDVVLGIEKAIQDWNSPQDLDDTNA